MKVSIIIPIKNRASLIGRTLDNLLAQSLKPYEIIIVDDNSQDDLYDALQSYRESVKVINSNGKGPGAARNTGLQLATGEAIQFFDSDDLITINKLESQAKLLESKNLDFVYGPYVKAEEINSAWLQRGDIMQYYRLPHDRLADLVLQGWCLLTQSVLFKAAFLKKLSGWRTDLMPHEDWEYWYQIALQKPRYLHENLSCVIYRQHGNQITDQAVNSVARMLDGIKASQIISTRVNSENSLHSRLAFKGHRANAITRYNKLVLPEQKLRKGNLDRIAEVYWKVWSRIEQRRSGSTWMRFHGANNSPKLFSEYLNNIS